MRPTLLFLLSFSLFFSFPVQATVWEIKPGTSIQKSVDRAKAGDTIRIMSGTYKEYEIVIRKPLTIIGIDHPTIDGGNKGNILIIAGNDIHITGLRITRTGKSNLDDSAGIKFFDAKNCSVTNNILYDTFFGLHFSNSSHLTIRGNRLESHAEKEYQTGNGIHLWKCTNTLIENNYIKGHRDGIYLEFVTNTESNYNQVEENKRYGLHFMFSHENSYYRNIFKKNGAGVAVMYTRNVTMKENIFEENWGSSAYGILLKDITDSEIIGNTFLKNTVGIHMEGSSRSLFKNNEFKQNGWAIKLMASCDQNIIEKNNFFGNTFDISSNGSVILNTLKENYWDKFEGYDLNKDKIGDIPYRPINLFSVIVEKIPVAIILWRSFLVTLLDRMEKVIPSITPENMIDNSPKMFPYDFRRTT